MRTAPSIVAGLLLLQSISGVQRDPSKSPTTRLSGRVTAADTGKPIRRATVQISSIEQLARQRPGRSVTTGADGLWEITGLPAGRYEVIAARGGYVTLGHGQRRPFGSRKVLEIAAGQTLGQIDIALPRASAIAGRITDDAGEPVTNAFVSAMRIRYQNGQRVLAPLLEGIPALLTGGLTDDLGHYRIHGLAPGTYYVSAFYGGDLATVAAEDVLRYASTYYPGTMSASEAQAVVLDVGQDAQNVSFALTPLRAATVSARIVSSAGQTSRVFARLIPAGGVVLPAAERSESSGADGSITFTNVQPGQYTLLAHIANSATPEAELGSAPVTVTGGEDITGILIVTAPGALVSGTLVLDDDKEKKTIAADAFSIRAASGLVNSLTLPGGSRVGVRADGTFSFGGLLGPHLLRLGHAPSGWQLEAVTIDGRDVTDVPYDFKPGQKLSSVEVTLTRRVGRIAGSAQDGKGKPSGGCAIVVFSTDPARWGFESRFVQTATAGPDGSFAIAGLAPDEYFVVALDSIEPGEETDRERLESWRANAVRVALADGESKSTVVTVR
ncbi:MAG TPA: carboxypeptidase-like regulatory domain-containing protein [Vicinamibacterales bacterium]|jgi:hypothetical protein